MSFDQIRDLDTQLQRVDSLQQMIGELKAAMPDAYDRIMEGWAIESTYNSNNIEGSTLSLGETALVYQGVCIDAPAHDIRQAEGGFAALRFLQESVRDGSVLTEELFKRAHELVYAEAKDPLTRGAYRRTEVEMTGTNFMPAPAIYVPERVASLIASCNRSRRHSAITSALFHLEFESIHPFVNANGRTGRLMSNFLLMRAGYEPVNIQAESRARYLNAIRSFQLEDDPYPFVALFVDNLLERQERVLLLLRPVVQPVTEEYDDSILAHIVGDDNYAAASDEVRDPVSDPVRLLLRVLGEREMSSSELMAALGLTHRTHFRRTYLSPALEAGLIVRTIPDKPNSRNQRYRRAR